MNSATKVETLANREAVYRIGELSKEFDVTLRTLRFYEDKGLLSPRRIGNTRLYSRADRTRLKLILRGKRFGFSLEEIRQLLDLYHVGDQQVTQLTKTYEIARERLADMERQREELTEAIEDLKEQLQLGEDAVAAMAAREKAAG